MEKIRIKDTGLNRVGGTKIYSTVSDDWIELHGMSLRHDLTVMTTDNQSTKINDDGELTFQSNEITGVQSPRLSLQGVVEISDVDMVKKLIKLDRTMGIKQLSGGAGIISAYPEAQNDTYDFIYVILKNFTIAEVVRDGTDYAKITIGLEQVQ